MCYLELLNQPRDIVTSNPEKAAHSDQGLRNFKEMKQVEIREAINKRRRKLNEEAKKQGKTYPESDEVKGDDLVGLALSGGGIRSAMFNLGLLQSMQRAGFLKHVDYLSSVSGGGYTNGYYSTLGHNDDTASKDHDQGLSAKDAQFLLDGQYLNRPTEFMTDYLLKTAVLFGTVFASVIFLASLIAIYFRLFDLPSVRRWLGLLDLNSDLRVGIFASVVLIFGVLVVRGICRGLQRYFGAVPAPAPGRWAIIATGIMLLGCAIMIGNGDFFVSDRLGFLPEKIDLKSLQIPIAVIVAIMFFPLMRIGSLVRSERINASVWQRVALWLVLSGATWGSFFVAVGYMGQENISRFINDRPPTFQKYDIFHYDRLAALLDDRELIQKLLKPNGLTKDQLTALADSILQDARNRNSMEKSLRPDNYQWDTWLDFDSATLQRWAVTILGMSGCKNQAADFVSWDHQLNEVHGPLLLGEINKLIKPTNLVVPSDSNDEPKADGSSLVESSEDDRELTQLLMIRAARKVAIRTKDIPENVRETLLPSPPKEPSDAQPSSNQSSESKEIAVRDALEILNRWVSQDSPMPRKTSSDPISFRDASNLRTILEVLAPAWTNHTSFPSHFVTPRESSATIDQSLDRLTPLDLWQFNRLLLEVAYPEVFKERRWISTSVTVFEDQKYRWAILIVSGMLAMVGILMVDINYLSPWFLFYRKRVHETFLRKAGQIDSETPLHALNPCEKGYPYPLFVGGLAIPHAPAYGRIQAAVMDGGATKPNSNINPSKVDGSFGSLWYSFLMSPLHVGWMQATTDPTLLEQKTYRSTKDYIHGGLTVSDAIVLSGAAVSTFMASNPALRILMQVFNIRLEQWLPNPITKNQPTKHQSLLFGGNKFVRFNTFQLFQEYAKSMRWSTHEFNAESWGYGVIADGGFREFLGVEELAARRCKIIVASDAGCNNGLYEFGVLADLIRKLRLDHNVEILDLDHDKPLDTKRLIRIGSENSLSPQHYIVGRIRYPDADTQGDSNDSEFTPPNEGLFVYVQMSLTGDEDIDIAQFKKTNPQFPDEPISNQFYSKDQVESFRQLGEHIGKLLCWDIDDFDCPNDEPEVCRRWRIEALDHAFREAYRSECRQESMVATDDARIGWMFDGAHPSKETVQIIHKFESPENTDHQILIRNFVWHCTDGYHLQKSNTPDPYFDFAKLQAADLYGIAIESNRRHSGFRPEWPTAFFQINGRDLLMRAAQRAVGLFGEMDNLHRGIVERLDPKDTQSQKLIAEFSRLAVMLPRAVFRLEGVKTAADVLVCMLNLGLKESPDGPVCPQEASRLSGKLLLHLRGEPVQKRIRKAVQTGNALEVEAVLGKVLSEFFASHSETIQKDNYSSLGSIEPQESEPNPNKPR
jgi:hypothetical protein